MIKPLTLILISLISAMRGERAERGGERNGGASGAGRQAKRRKLVTTCAPSEAKKTQKRANHWIDRNSNVWKF